MAEKEQTLAETGELEFIKRIKSMMPSEGGHILRAAGDDCLAVETPAEHLMLYTTDTFVDSVHFTDEYATFEKIGCRCMAASVSDIAAMSGLPQYSLVSLSMPPKITFNDAVSLFDGLSTTASHYGCPVSGGETTSTPGPLTVTVTVIGSVEPERMITRSGARAGDSIYVTGFPGDAMAGLLAFRTNEAGFVKLKKKFLTPEAKVLVARHLTESFSINAMIDVSDGIATDLRHICEESGKGAEVETGSLPLSLDFHKLMKKSGRDPIDFALTAGEDFELLFTSDDTSIPDTFHALGCRVSRIGTVTGTPYEIELKLPGGSVQTLSAKGYEHFKS